MCGDSIVARFTRTGGATTLPDSAEMVIRYPIRVPISDGDLEQIILASLVPIGVSTGVDLTIATGFDVSERARAYWRRYLAHFGMTSVRLDFERGGGRVERGWSARLLRVRRRAARGHRLGILFGGGVESLFGAWQLKAHRPDLIALTGDGFMNNDHGRSDIKRRVEEDFQKASGLVIRRIETNIRRLALVGDLEMNQHATGFWMYFYSVPLMRALGIGALLKISEYEEASIFWDYDRSINARFLQHIPGDEALPTFLPMFNAFAKIQMFEELARTPFFPFVYSCLNNSEKRWCGECGKCRRIAEYCRRLGIDSTRIGLDPGVAYVSPGTETGKLYEEMMDRLYPPPS